MVRISSPGRAGVWGGLGPALPPLCAVRGAAPGRAESAEASPLCSPFGGGALSETTEHQLNAGLQPSPLSPARSTGAPPRAPLWDKVTAPPAQSPSPAPVPSPKPSFILSVGGYGPSEDLAPPPALTLMRCTPLPRSSFLRRHLPPGARHSHNQMDLSSNLPVINENRIDLF